MNKEYINKFIKLGLTSLYYDDHIINEVEKENDFELSMLFTNMELEYNEIVYHMLGIVQIERDDIEFSHFSKDSNNDIWANWYDTGKPLKLTSDDYEKDVFRFMKEILNKKEYQLLIERYDTEQLYKNKEKVNDFDYSGSECKFVIEDWIGTLIEVSDSLVDLLEMQDDEPNSDLTIYYVDCKGNAKAPII